MDYAKNRADGGAFLSHMNEGESPRQILDDETIRIQGDFYTMDITAPSRRVLAMSVYDSHFGNLLKQATKAVQGYEDVDRTIAAWVQHADREIKPVYQLS